MLDEAEGIVQGQGVAEEELGGGARVSGIEAAVRGLVEAGVVSVGKKYGGGGRVRFLIGEEEVKAALSEDGDIGGVVGREIETSHRTQTLFLTKHGGNAVKTTGT
ncbi:hypothetical protein L873DRAFT_615494 [Choiromyces venosus 120613-1]|uniref:Uncharacterized protein n=1 Tax=Choiromyces venosus 120613-1 TaxID=1336337 RepID=A0A3N4IY15_9PEZI|nr:hypothetical protein L873DRAFT_615494 [Choiromyces venosus 120613-1]